MSIFTAKEQKYFSKNKIFLLIANVLNLISYLIIVLLPSSDFANSFKRDGKDAVYVLFGVAAVSLISLVLYSVPSIKNLPKGSGTLVSKIVTGYNLLLFFYAFVVNLAFAFNQLKLGFVAPVRDTAYATIDTIYLALTILGIGSVIFVFIVNKKQRGAI